MSKVLYARVDDEVHDRLTLVAEATGMTIRAVANLLLRRALDLPDHAEPLADALRRAGISQ